MEDRSAEGISSRLALVAKLILLRLPVPELPQRFVGLENLQSRRVQNDFWGEESKYEIARVCIPSALVIKNLSANAGDVSLILCWEDPLEKEMATHSSILAWRTPWTGEPGRLQSMESQKSST